MKLDARMTMFMTLVGVFLTCLIVGNLIGGKLTEVHVFGRDWIISVGEIPFPLTFIITDLINEFYGRKTARRVTLLGFSMIGLTVLIIQLANQAAWFPPAFTDPNWGKSNMTPFAFDNVFMNAVTIQIASMFAFLTAQYVDIGVFFLVKRATGDRFLWLRATGSTAVSQMIDTVLIVWIAFGFDYGAGFPFVHRSPMSFDTITTIIITSYVVKVTVAVLVTPIIYALHGLIERVWHVAPLPASVASGDL
ncbi:MAG: queuosine precursor transporter [Myxococcales bacterium]|nr:queuosine precursor transporter [Myxococcales bacterium]